MAPPKPPPAQKPPSSAAHPGLGVSKPTWRERLQRFVAVQRAHEAHRWLVHEQRTVLREVTRQAKARGRALPHVDDLVFLCLNDEGLDALLTRFDIVSEKMFIGLAKSLLDPDPRGFLDDPNDAGLAARLLTDAACKDGSRPSSPWRRVFETALLGGRFASAQTGIRVFLAAASEPSSRVGALLAEHHVTGRQLALCAAHDAMDESPPQRPTTPLARVVVHNDPLTRAADVCVLLRKHLELPHDAAHALTMFIHEEGRADVYVGETDDVMARAAALRDDAATACLGLAIDVEGVAA